VFDGNINSNIARLFKFLNASPNEPSAYLRNSEFRLGSDKIRRKKKIFKWAVPVVLDMITNKDKQVKTQLEYV